MMSIYLSRGRFFSSTTITKQCLVPFVESHCFSCRRWNTNTTHDTSEPQILLERLAHPEHPDVHVSRLCLNRPKANAMGSTMLQELSDSIDVLHQQTNNNDDNNNDDDVNTRCVVLTSHSPKIFSAGADLKQRATMSQRETVAFVSRLRMTMERLARLPVPVLAAVEGVAVGGGLELALAADVRIAGARALLGLPETTLAIVPGAGGTQRLPRLVGVAKAKELIFTGRRIDGATALNIGLVQHVVEEGQAEAKAMEMAWEIAKNGPVAIRAAKEAIDVGMEASDMVNALYIERRCYGKTVPTQDRLEGLAAFREGRPPVYKGR